MNAAVELCSQPPRGNPFADFYQPLNPQQGQSPLRDAISMAYRLPEPQAVQSMLELASQDAAGQTATDNLARQLAQGLRQQKQALGRAGLVQGLLREFALSSQEGVALMCLAEALLRIPDAATRDALIRDKIGGGDWQAHVGASPSLFVNAAAWGLLLTGKLVATHSEEGLAAALRRAVAKSGEPLVRKGVDFGLRMMGEQFVTGETIDQALVHARTRETQGFRYSYDMLGEAAMTEHDAQRYLASYEAAIHAIGKASKGLGIYRGPGISVKLSALHPRYSRAQAQRVMQELYPRLLHLATLARHHDIGINIDAEESDRLELSLDLLERLCFEPGLTGWNGIGFVIQAYQKRCPFVVVWLIDLARRSGHRLMVRLVKGAYWDSEIKRAQVDGQDGFSVYTRKSHTDVAYLACARKLLAAPAQIYPQFATHNAQTLAAIHTLAGPGFAEGHYEFQCLHGMGEPLYEQVVGPNQDTQDTQDGKLGRPCRIYAPVGTHETLLAYLVRRLLENGANTSFVNRMADTTLAINDLIEDPVQTVRRQGQPSGQTGLPHPAIALPAELLKTGAASDRANSSGLDLSNEISLKVLHKALLESAATPWTAGPMVDGPATASVPRAVLNPADPGDLVGHVTDADAADVQAALQAAHAAASRWAMVSPQERANRLHRAADLMQEQMPGLMGLLVREAGKTAANATAEVREAVDFLRYYAHQVSHEFDNTLHLPMGPVVCISPWNFPLAIFVGQVAAALAAGNVALAKPAEQTCLIAAQAVRLLWQAGVPPTALQLLPGNGETVGAALVADGRVNGVLFTGSTEVARLIQRSISQRLTHSGQPVMLIAETGGQNAMLVDSSALLEQVATDVLASAFDSAGQRCSALRVLCVQEDVADRLIRMIEGAAQELLLGNPAKLAVDVGPVIDRDAQQQLIAHIEAMRTQGQRVWQPVAKDGKDSETSCGQRGGYFVPPTVIEIDSIRRLGHEVFGPVLHVLRYRRGDLDAVLAQINATGFGLTMGLHTRIDETIDRVARQTSAGNLYVNRNMVGAVVGVQPFGGHGLSGTGPKAGGPLYLLRLLQRRPSLGLAANPAGFAVELPGPTGESNVYSLHPRRAVLCLADSAQARARQLSAVAQAGSQPLVVDMAALDLATSVLADPTLAFDLVLHHGSRHSLQNLLQALARRPGPIVTVVPTDEDNPHIPLERLVVERCVSINTAAAGGNAGLMAVG